jgi:hypothetical protein
MSILVLAVPVVAGLVIALAVALLAGRRVAVSPASAPVDPVAHAVVQTIATRTTAWRLGGLGAGVSAVAVLAAAPPSWLGLGITLAGPAFALCLLAGVLMGEIAGTTPVGPTRTAAIEVRAVRSYLPRAMARWVVALGAALVVLLSLTSVTGNADDLGRAGRAFTQSCAAGQMATVGPWPGAYYSLPIGATVLIGLGAAAVTAQAVSRRRRPAPEESVRAADDRARRASARAITAACGVLVAAPLAGSAVITGMALLGNVCAPNALSALGWAAIAIGLAAAVATCWFAMATMLPYRSASR